MSRRSRKGYYVDGKFIKGLPEPPTDSRTAKKKASERLQELGEQLIAARPSELAALPLPEPLKDAILDAKTFASAGAIRRQRQFIGKLMRTLDDETVAAIRTALRVE
jgi:ribosome-associated protein